ncbi:ribose-phosphate pyrophosphokinase [Piedraia hortae CBS 480.64]|uniref:ribose-phosphate diphosphokinase n=1 Tax=Piedraia hortae CBS 480.64 TaxID=1314780 RepID=A0A6A7C2F8_9PEZI|nr:ribose-phosphate pyrophosphokinase [Piedraia hortae CBS 480.64]
MVRNIVIFSGSSHAALTDQICNYLGLPRSRIELGKFAVGETRVEIGESVREKDVFIVQSGGGMVNDHLMELLITISACKTASAKRVTAVMPLFPYSRQSDLPYNKEGAPLVRVPTNLVSGPSSPRDGPSSPTTSNGNGNGNGNGCSIPDFTPARGYRQWVAQAGTLVADLLTCAGADHIITMDLHDPQYQGFFDIPVDNLYGRNLLSKYIEHHILPNSGAAGAANRSGAAEASALEKFIIVSPDAGGAKRASHIADSLGLDLALIHKERSSRPAPTNTTNPLRGSMLLVGNVTGRTAILIDDLADTCHTITRAARLLKKKGAEKIFALVTHGVFSGDACERIVESDIDVVVTTDSVDQMGHVERCGGKLRVLEVGPVFAEAIRRVHFGESISALFDY